MVDIKVAIVETSVFGVKAYHCKCLTCGWKSKPRDTESQAVTVGKAHRCK